MSPARDQVAVQVAALRRALEQARAMPMSTSVVVNRADLLRLLDALESALAEENAARGEDAQVSTARRAAEELEREADAYVDTKLAEFEVALERTLDTVRRGRRRLAREGRLEEFGDGQDGEEIVLPEHLR